MGTRFPVPEHDRPPVGPVSDQFKNCCLEARYGPNESPRLVFVNRVNRSS